MQALLLKKSGKLHQNFLEYLINMQVFIYIKIILIANLVFIIRFAYAQNFAHKLK